MIIFTYETYLKYANLKRFYLKEDNEEYSIKQKKKTHQYSDKVFKEILSNKKEFIKFLQKYIDKERFKHLSEGNLEKYNKEFITSKFRKKECDIIYKISNLNMYIIVEHQSKVDYTMPERITEYCIELMRDINANKMKKEISRPIIVPIVLYTGQHKWNVENRKKQIFPYRTFEYSEYNLVDISNDTKEELIEEKTGLSKALLFENIKTKEEFKEVMNKVIRKDLTAEEIKYIQMILMYSNKIRKFMPEGREEYIEKLNIGGEEDMKFEKFLIEWLQDEKREGEKSGIAKAINQMVKEMLKKQMSDNDIMEITKINKEELERIKTS